METDRRSVSLVAAPWRAFCIRQRAIAADVFKFGMCFEPGSQGLRLAVGQQIDDLMAFEVDQDRAVALPTPESEVIYA